MLGKSPEQCEKEFKKQGRRGLNIYEGLAIIRKCPNILKKHYIDLVGSRYKQSDEVPDVYLNDDGPELGSDDFGYSHGKWGSASCRSNRDLDIGFLDLFGTLELNGYKYEIKIKSIK